MKNLKIGSVFLYLLAGVFGSAYANDISISANVDKHKISMNDYITLHVSVSGDTNNLPNPQLPNLDTFAVSSSGRSQNISIVNGKMSSAIVYNYILAPRSAGKYTIDSVVIKHKGVEYKTNPISIEVIAAQTQQPVKQSQQGGQKISATQRRIFITTSVDKKNPFVNEQLVLTFRFYSSISLLSQPAYTAPGVTGFWTEDLPPQRRYIAADNGRRYNVVEIKTALFPAASGKYTISPAQLQCTVQDFDRGSSSDPFDDFFGGFFSSGKTVTLHSDPINIRVKPLPEDGKPTSFTGSVGSFSMNVDVDRKKIEIGDAVTLIVTIKGDGNIKSIGEPRFTNTANFRQYDTITSFSVIKDNYKVSGSKIFKTVFVPKVHGKLSLPSVEFSFFDTQKKYRILKAPKREITVLPSTRKIDDITGVKGKIPLSSDVKVITEDIRFIKQKTRLSNVRFLFTQRIWFWILLFGMPLIYFGGLVLAWHRARKQGMISIYKKRKAVSLALKTIRQAKKAKNDEVKAVQLLFCALSEYLGNKCILSPIGMTFKEVQNILEKHDVNEETQNEIRLIWDELDFMRFSPSMIKKERISELAKELEYKIIQWDKKMYLGK